MEEPLYLKSVDAIDEPLYPESVDAIDKPSYPKSVDAVDKPSYPKSVDAVDKPSYPKSVDAVDKPSYPKSVDAVDKECVAVAAVDEPLYPESPLNPRCLPCNQRRDAALTRRVICAFPAFTELMQQHTTSLFKLQHTNGVVDNVQDCNQIEVQFLHFCP